MRLPVAPIVSAVLVAALCSLPARAQETAPAAPAAPAPAAAPAAAAPPARAPDLSGLADADGETIADVRFEGLVRIDRETAQRRIRTAAGGTIDRAVVAEDIKSLYGLGAFDDIVVLARDVEGGTSVVFVVAERPAIDQILVEGNDEVSEEDIRKKITLRSAAILDTRRVERNAESIKEHYVEQGFFLAEIDWRLVTKPDNLVDVVFVIREHAKVKVQSIEFTGNLNVPAAEIKPFLATQEGNLLGFLSGKGMFSRELFEDDVKRIEFFYNTKGYAEVRVDPPVVMLSRDRKYITIAITVHEGLQYNVGKVTIDGDLILPREELEKRLALKPGQLFNAMNVQKDDTMLADLAKDQGYAFATVGNPHVLHREERLIDLSYVIQKGEKAHFGRIDITGNDGTRDWTIRRELRIYEGDWYSETKLRESEARIKRLGFFEKVEVRTRPGRAGDLVDVTVEVKERQTGAFTVGAGISSVENFMFQAQVSKQNFMGRGQNVSFQAILSSLRTIFMLSFEDPYFLDTDFTFGVDAYNYETSYYNFTRATTGFNITFGRRLTDEFGVSANYKLDSIGISTGGSQGVTDIPIAHLSESGLTSALTGTVWYDSRDDRMFPTKGNMSSMSVEWATRYLGSEFEYLRIDLKARQYIPLILGAVMKIQGEFGWIGNPGGGPVPLFERFYVGGIFSVRGFERYSLGPTVPTGATRDPSAYLNPFTIGGNKQLIFNAEIEFPIFMPVGIRGVVFFDAGNAFDDGEAPNPLKLRLATGFGIRWWSPIGPLRFEWGFPLDRQEGEAPYVFEFNIGTF